MKTYNDVFNGNGTALIPFFVLGDPDFDRSLELIRTAVEAGADVLELGIPFSDPIADGPTIQRADVRALDDGMTCERAFELMCKRAASRYAHGSLLIEKQTIQNWIAESRMQIDAARLFVLYAAWKMDTIGKKEARQEISMIKIVAARCYLDVLDRAIQVHGAMGVTNDTPLAHMWQHARTLRIVDGPDEVHLQAIARRESRPYMS